MDVTQSPGLLPPEAISALVVYDARTGEVLHRHIAVRYPGGRVQEPAQLEARALALAVTRGIDARRARVLQVDPAAFGSALEHRVDVKRGVLIARRCTPLNIATLARRARKAKK
jgi:hypothetical protein